MAGSAGFFLSFSLEEYHTPRIRMHGDEDLCTEGIVLDNGTR